MKKKIRGHGGSEPPAWIQTRNTKIRNRPSPDPDPPARLRYYRNSQTPSGKGLAIPPTGHQSGPGSSQAAVTAARRRMLKRKETMPWIKTLKVKEVWRSKKTFSALQTRIRWHHGGSCLTFRSLPKVDVPSEHATTPMGAAHRNGPANPLSLMARRGLLPGPNVLYPTNQFIGPTVPKTHPAALSQQPTQMNRTQIHQSSPNASGSGQSQRSSKVRLVGTSYQALSVHLEFVLTRLQTLISSLRNGRHGKPGIQRTRKFALPEAT